MIIVGHRDYVVNCFRFLRYRGFKGAFGLGIRGLGVIMRIIVLREFEEVILYDFANYYI